VDRGAKIATADPVDLVGIHFYKERHWKINYWGISATIDHFLLWMWVFSACLQTKSLLEKTGTFYEPAL
jgi:hypothetical protein